MATCHVCNGKKKCTTCNGRGLTGGILPVNCKTCNGKQSCFACNGTGSRR